MITPASPEARSALPVIERGWMCSRSRPRAGPTGSPRPRSGARSKPERARAAERTSSSFRFDRVCHIGLEVRFLRRCATPIALEARPGGRRTSGSAQGVSARWLASLSATVRVRLAGRVIDENELGDRSGSERRFQNELGVRSDRSRRSENELGVRSGSERGFQNDLGERSVPSASPAGRRRRASATDPGSRLSATPKIPVSAITSAESVPARYELGVVCYLDRRAKDRVKITWSDGSRARRDRIHQRRGRHARSDRTHARAAPRCPRRAWKSRRRPPTRRGGGSRAQGAHGALIRRGSAC
jgi:hypothetical protein